MRIRNGVSIAAAAALLLAGCQRAPADVSAVAYQVLEQQKGEHCTVCLVPARAACAGGEQPGELHWNLPAGLDATQLRIQLVRTDGKRIDLAAGTTSGAASFTEVLQEGDRIEVVDAAASRQLVFIRPATDLVCAPAS